MRTLVASVVNLVIFNTARVRMHTGLVIMQKYSQSSIAYAKGGLSRVGAFVLPSLALGNDVDIHVLSALRSHFIVYSARVSSSTFVKPTKKGGQRVLFLIMRTEAISYL